MSTPLFFQCVDCESPYFTFGFGSPSTMLCVCNQCNTDHKFDLSSGFGVLTHVNGARFVLGQIQENAETVPAPAPVSGHLSTETVDK